MYILDSMCWLCGIDRKWLSQDEQSLLDALLLDLACEELNNFYQENNKMEMTRSVVNLMLLDLINSNDYTISGVAAYANLPEEVVYDIAMGSITNPTINVSRKIIKLHMGARGELYQRVMQKITEKYWIEKQGI
jgi:hypothetical protein